MSYGWVRSELLGGLTNGCFLLAICLYVVLESIPKFIEPRPIEAGFVFIIVAAVGLAVNTIGTFIFGLLDKVIVIHMVVIHMIVTDMDTLQIRRIKRIRRKRRKRKITIMEKRIPMNLKKKKIKKRSIKKRKIKKRRKVDMDTNMDMIIRRRKK